MEIVGKDSLYWWLNQKVSQPKCHSQHFSKIFQKDRLFSQHFLKQKLNKEITLLNLILLDFHPLWTFWINGLKFYGLMPKSLWWRQINQIQKLTLWSCWVNILTPFLQTNFFIKSCVLWILVSFWMVYSSCWNIMHARVGPHHSYVLRY